MTTSQALGSDNQALSRRLSNLPGALNKGAATFARLRQTTLPALSHLVDATRAGDGATGAVPDAAAARCSMRPTPTFGALSQAVRPARAQQRPVRRAGGPAAACQAGHGDFPRAIKALHQSTPIFEFARPYIPDLVAWVTNWDGMFAPYDANGHYARTVPVFDAFSFNDDAQGGTLIPKPTNLARLGRSAADRASCSAARVGDRAARRTRSAPFVDSGPLSNPHCRAVGDDRRQAMRMVRGVIAVLALFALAARSLARGRSHHAPSGSSGGYMVRAVFDNSSFVIPGEDVKVAGVTVGTIHAVELTSRTRPRWCCEIDNRRFEPFRADAHCEIGLESLLGEQFVQCTPTQPRRGGCSPRRALAAIASGPDKGQHVLPVQNTTTPVGLDLLADITRLPAAAAPAADHLGARRGAGRQRAGAQRGAAARRPGAAADRPGDRRARRARTGCSRD